MKKIRKILCAIIVPIFGAWILFATTFNEAFHIKRACPEAEVSPSERFTPVLSLWDLASIIVPGDYISPIDYAQVVVSSATTPVDVSEILRRRVGYLAIYDSEISNYEEILQEGYSGTPIMIMNSKFLDASRNDIEILRKKRTIDEESGKDVYVFGNV